MIHFDRILFEKKIKNLNGEVISAYIELISDRYLLIDTRGLTQPCPSLRHFGIELKSSAQFDPPGSLLS